jgi:hypothetical protein
MKRFFAFILIAALATCFVACGPKDTTTETQVTETNPPTVETTASTEAPETAAPETTADTTETAE